jgi:hypothetical protein
VFENWVLRKIFGSKREGVTRGWSNLHNGFMICISCWNRHFREDGIGEARMGEKRKCIQSFDRKLWN